MSDSFANDDFPHRQDGEFDSLRRDQWRSLELLLLEKPGQAVSLYGAPGAGKTKLAKRFANAHQDRFPGGTWFVQAATVGDWEKALQRVANWQRALLILDEADRVPVDQLAEVMRRIRAENPLVSVLTTSNVHLAVGAETPGVGMPPLTSAQVINMLERQSGLTSLQVEQLARLLSGNAAATSAASDRLAAGLPAKRLLEWLKSGRVPVALDPAGRELSPGSINHERLDIAIAEVSEELIETLAARPELLYRLDPRKFEQLVAELYRRQGFEAKLTPRSGDEGVDVYVVSRSDLGRTLWVVQAKRHAPENRIEAGVVRELFGTVVAKEASAGVLITTSFFQPGAERLERQFEYRLSLKNYLDLQELLRKPRRV